MTKPDALTDYLDPAFRDESPYFARYENLDTHWFCCSCCGGVSWDSDTAALAGRTELTPEMVTHDKYCPGKSLPAKYVRRITKLY